MQQLELDRNPTLKTSSLALMHILPWLVRRRHAESLLLASGQF
jgi:hypothetical protein